MNRAPFNPGHGRPHIAALLEAIDLRTWDLELATPLPIIELDEDWDR